MSRIHVHLGPLLKVAFFASMPLLCHAQAAAPAGTRSLTITGAVKQTLTLTAKDLAQFRRTEVKVDDHGTLAVYEGVLLSDILQKAGASLGKEMHGKMLASYVLATAKDGYQVVYALAEIDPSLTSARIVLADELAGKPLSDSLGPFRIVAPDDKKMARSIRMVEKIEVVLLRP